MSSLVHFARDVPFLSKYLRKNKEQTDAKSAKMQVKFERIDLVF